MTLRDQLSLAPLKEEPNHVLDVGTGTGIWALEYGTVPALLFWIPMTESVLFSNRAPNINCYRQRSVAHPA